MRLKIRGNVLRILFGINLILYRYSMLLPWAMRTHFAIFRGPYGTELYWSFQTVTLPPRSSSEFNLLFPWEPWSGYERLLFRDFWFSHEMFYNGFTYDWIRIFIYQSLTVVSGILLLAWLWKKTKFMLLPSSFSILSVLTGLLILPRFGYAPVSGYVLAIPSALVFLALFTLRYALERREIKSN
jgi:hypothetical protein